MNFKKTLIMSLALVASFQTYAGTWNCLASRVVEREVKLNERQTVSGGFFDDEYFTISSGESISLFNGAMEVTLGNDQKKKPLSLIYKVNGKTLKSSGTDTFDLTENRRIWATAKNASYAEQAVVECSEASL